MVRKTENFSRAQSIRKSKHRLRPVNLATPVTLAVLSQPNSTTKVPPAALLLMKTLKHRRTTKKGGVLNISLTGKVNVSFDSSVPKEKRREHRLEDDQYDMSPLLPDQSPILHRRMPVSGHQSTPVQVPGKAKSSSIRKQVTRSLTKAFDKIFNAKSTPNKTSGEQVDSFKLARCKKYRYELIEE
jgi:hypothetical protein